MGLLKKLKPAAITVFVIVVFQTFTLFDELTLISESERVKFAAGKLAFVITTLLAGLLLQKTKKAISTPANLLLVFSFIGYALFSSLYRPWYVIGILQLSLLFAFLIPHTKRFYWTYSVIAFGSFSALMMYRWPHVPENAELLSLGDWNNLGAQFAAMGGLVYVFFVRERRYKERSEARMLSIGKNASRVMADLTQLSNLPREHLRQVEMIVSGQGQSPLSDILNLTQNQLSLVRNAMLELSSLTASTTKDFATFDLMKKLRSLSETFAPYGKSKIAVQIRGDIWLKTDRSLISSLIFNLCSNSIKAFDERATESPVISWELLRSPLRLVYEDNGGGFSPEALQAVQNEVPFSGFRNGSGLGYQLIRDSVRALGGKLKVENSANGIRVTWTLPAAIETRPPDSDRSEVLTASLS